MIVEIIRHGETDLQARGCYQGRSDPPLSEAGHKALCFSGHQPKRVYVTPLRRAEETARLLFPQAEQVVVPDLREMDFGEFEGKNYRELSGNPVYQAWVDGFCMGKCPGGESRQEFTRRVCDSFARLLDGALARGETELVIVAHGGTQMAVMEAFALPEKDYFDWHLPSGKGYRLDASRWQTDRKLNLLDVTSYTKE